MYSWWNNISKLTRFHIINSQRIKKLVKPDHPKPTQLFLLLGATGPKISWNFIHKLLTKQTKINTQPVWRKWQDEQFRNVYLIMVGLVAGWPGIVAFMAVFVTVTRYTADAPGLRHRVPAIKLVWVLVPRQSCRHTSARHNRIKWLTVVQNRCTDKNKAKAISYFNN